MSTAIKAICFDFDGTLACYQGDFAAFGARSFAALGLPFDQLGAAMMVFSQCEKQNGHITVPIILRCVLARLALETRVDIDRVSQQMLQDYAADSHLLAGARELLACSAGLPTAIITNGPSDMQRAAIAAAGVAHAVDHILVSGDADIATRKPDATIFKLACDRLGTAPDQTLMIGDNLSADIKGALAAGLQALWLGAGEPGIEAVADTYGALEYVQHKLASARV